MRRIVSGTIVAIALLVAGSAAAQSEPSIGWTAAADPAKKGGDDRNGPYDLIAGWWKPAPDHDSIWTYGSASGVWPDTPDRVLVVFWGDQRRNPIRAPGGGGGGGQVPTGRNNPNERQRNFLMAVNRDGKIVAQAFAGQIRPKP